MDASLALYDHVHSVSFTCGDQKVLEGLDLKKDLSLRQV
jgi:hypothetical protein